METILQVIIKYSVLWRVVNFDYQPIPKLSVLVQLLLIPCMHLQIWKYEIVTARELSETDELGVNEMKQRIQTNYDFDACQLFDFWIPPLLMFRLDVHLH